MSIETLISVCFLLNVLFNLRTTVELTDEIITAPGAIAQHYVCKSGAFWWDLVSVRAPVMPPPPPSPCLPFPLPPPPPPCAHGARTGSLRFPAGMSS